MAVQIYVVVSTVVFIVLFHMMEPNTIPNRICRAVFLILSLFGLVSILIAFDVVVASGNMRLI